MHGGRPDAEAIAEAMGGEYECFQATAQLFRGREQGNALIWRRGLFETAPEVVSLSDLPGVRLTRVERTLLRAIPPQRRIAVRAESAALRVYVMHLDVIGFAHKLEQFRAIVKDIANRPPANCTEPGSACSRCAAMARPFSITACAAWYSAVPPICIERAPPWPLPVPSTAVSACTSRKASAGNPRTSAAICG